MVVGVALAPDDASAEMTERVFKSFWRGDTGEGASGFALEPSERKFFAAPNVFENGGGVITFDDIGVGIEAADFIADLGDVAAALCEEDDVGAANVTGRFAKDAAGEHVAIAEGIGGIDEDDFDGVLQLFVLEAIVENKGVATEAFDGVAASFDAVAVDDDGDTREVRGEHVRFIAACGRVEEEVFTIGNDERRFDNLGENALPEGGFFATVAARENGDAAALGGKGACKDFGDRSFTCAARGDVANGDDLHAQGKAAENAPTIERITDRNDRGKNETHTFEKGEKDTYTKALALVRAFLLNEFDEVAFETFNCVGTMFAHKRN